MKLPQKQTRLLTFVDESLARNGFAPSHGEIAQGIGVSRSGVHRMLQELERKGYIQRQLGSSRNVQVTRFPGLEQNTYSDTNSASINMPPKAGKDGDESNLVRHQADLLVAMLGNTDHFKMTVTDNAMVGAGILPGDVAIVHRCCNVSNGCVAAVFYKGDLLLRRLVKTSSRVLLKVANEHSVEHLISIDEVQIRGELITLLRNCLPGGLALAR